MLLNESLNLKKYECDPSVDSDCYAIDLLDQESDEMTTSASIASTPAALGQPAFPHSGGVKHSFKGKGVLLNDYIRDYCKEYPKKCRNKLP